MDELDKLVTPKQDMVYNFFNWPCVGWQQARRYHRGEYHVMTGRVRSRLGKSNYFFLDNLSLTIKRYD
jgi:origin recognition complex subunit 1